MLYEKEFTAQHMARNDTLNRAVCIILVIVEGGRLLGYALSQNAVGQTLDAGYIRYYLTALVLIASYWVLDQFTSGDIRQHRMVQLIGLSAALLWACLYGRLQLKQGNAGTIFPQMLLLTSAGPRSPGPFHVGVNILLCMAYILLLCVSGLPVQVLICEITDTVIYLFVSVIVILATYHFSYDSYRTANKTLEARNAQMDIMSEQIKQLQSMERKIMVARHDMRHYAWEVQQGLELGDMSIIEAATESLTRDMEEARSRGPIQIYTGDALYDAIFSQTAHWANINDVELRVEMTIPKRMQPHDLTLILMNALDNATKAVSAQEDGTPKFIRIMSSSLHGQYFLEIDNSFRPGSVEISGEDRLPKTKEPGHGYGTKSMASILNRYGAAYRFQTDQSTFQFQFLLSDDEK